MRFRLLARLACLSPLVLAACGDDGKTSDSSASTTGSSSTTGASTDSGTGGTDGSSGGTPTTGDASTGGGGSGVQICIEECDVDADCQAMGMDLGLKCQGGLCSSGNTGGCTEDFDCTVLLSWQIPCNAQTPCPPNYACVDIGGGDGRCATTPTPDLPCDLLQQSEIQAMTIDGMQVTVCAITGYECRESICFNPCESDADCQGPDLPKCNVGTGLCECTSDADCKTEGRPVCKTTYCGCGGDADCQGPNNPNTDTCYDGLCGCGGDATCTTKAFDGTSISCKSF